MKGNPKFWNCWNHMPIPNNHTDITKTWLSQPDQQLSQCHLLKKTLSRLFFLWVTKQRNYLRTSIAKDVKKILWLHISDNVGDSLMRLAPVQLLKNLDVDLCSTGAATQIFQAGQQFMNVYKLGQDNKQVLKNNYDVVIIDAIQTKPLKYKIQLAKTVPFVTLHEFFHFCRDDYNPIYYTWWRMQYLLRDISSVTGEPHLCLTISASDEHKIVALHLPQDIIAIAVGGREAYRTYQAWDQVVANLIKKNPQQPIILLGSENGRAIAEKIALQYQVINAVAQYSLTETAAIIRQSSVLYCADGGLLHVANAVGTKTISLFAQELPEWRYIKGDKYYALCADDDVNQISAADINAINVTG